MILIKTVDHVFCQTFQLWRFRLVAVNNPVPSSQVGFEQFRAIERFCVEGSNKRSDRGHFSNALYFLTDRTFRASFSDFYKFSFHFICL